MSKFKVLDNAVAYTNEVIKNVEVISGLNLAAYRDFLAELSLKIYDLAELRGEMVATEMFLTKIVNELEKSNNETKNLVLKYINVTDRKALTVHLAQTKTIQSGLQFRYPNVDFSNDLELYLKNKLELMKLTKPNHNTDSKSVFDDSIITTLHNLFNNEEIWEKILLKDFLTTFYGEGCKLKLLDNKQSLFCFILGEIEELRHKEACPNFDLWVKDTFRIDDYKGQKRNKAKEGSKAWLERQNISRKIRLNLME